MRIESASMITLQKTNATLVSVAVITFNQKDYIGECLDSALRQTYRPLEIIVADDGSSDGTRDIILRYAADHPGVVIPVFAPANAGVTANSTAAHQACTGKYIAWLGGDDIMADDKIARQVAVMEADDRIAVCYHDLDVFDSATDASLRRFSEMNQPREGGIETAIRYGTFNGGSATMVRRASAPECYDARIPVASDWLYWVECLQGGGRMVYINAVLGRYRRHTRNVTAETSATRLLLLDHLMTCAIILVRMPCYAGEVSHSTARLLVSLARRSKTGRTRIMLLAIATIIAATAISITGALLRLNGTRHER